MQSCLQQFTSRDKDRLKFTFLLRDFHSDKKNLKGSSLDVSNTGLKRERRERTTSRFSTVWADSTFRGEDFWEKIAAKPQYSNSFRCILKKSGYYQPRGKLILQKLSLLCGQHSTSNWPFKPH